MRRPVSPTADAANDGVARAVTARRRSARAAPPALRRLRSLAAPALLLLAACAGPTGGTLDLTLTSPELLPVELDMVVDVIGAAGVVRSVTSSERFSLAPGTYELVARTSRLPDEGYVGVDRYGAPPLEVEVVGGATTEATIRYSYLGATIDDPEGDAEGVSATYPIFDVVELRTDVDYGASVVTVVITFAEAHDTLAGVSGQVYLDADRDPATGTAPPAFCTIAGIGVDYVVVFDEVAATADVFDTDLLTVTPVDWSIDERTVSLVLPFGLVGGSGEPRIAALIGNPDTPTDCVPGGSPVL